MDLLVFGDPEGMLQRYKKRLQKIILKYNPEYVVFLGDYYLIQEYYYNKLTRYKRTKNLYDLFPEAILVKELVDKHKYVFVYGNKDIEPKVLRLSKEREKNKLDNWFFVQNKIYGEAGEFFIINGSNLICFTEKMEPVIKYIDILLKKYKKKRVVELRKIIRGELIKRFGKRTYNIIFGTYSTNFRGLTKVRTNKEILLTHTPPYLKDVGLIFGNYPDYAIYKEVEGGVAPVEKEEEGIKKENVGNKHIRKFVDRNNFSLVLCGHIHEGSGIARVGNTIVINPGSILSPLNKNNEIPHVYIKLRERRAYIKLISWVGEFKKEIEI